MSIDITSNVNFMKLNRNVKQEISVFPHYKVDKRPNKEPNKSFQKGKSEDKGAVAFMNIVPQFGLCLARLSAIITSEKREVSVKPEA